MIFNVFRNKDRTQKAENKKAKEAMRHVEREKKEQERRAKKEKRQAEKVEKERKEREKQFCTLDELLKGAPFSSVKLTAVAYRIVTMDEAIGWEEHHPTAFIEIVMTSGERHFLHNRVRASTKNLISDSCEKKYFHFSPIPIREAETALECVLPKFSPISLNCVTSDTQNCPLDPTEKTTLTISPEQANPSELILDYGLMVARFWLDQKNKLCSRLEISNKTYDICRKRFEQQAEVFSREIEKLAENSDDRESESRKNPSVPDKKSRTSGSSSYSSQLNRCESKITDIDQPPEDINNSAQSDMEIDPTEEELLISLKTLKQIQPIKFRWNEILSFRVVYILSGNQRYSTIQLISKGGIRDDIIYHELPGEIANGIFGLKSDGETISFSGYYLPLDIRLAEKALEKVMPELSSREVYAETYNAIVCFKNKEQKGITVVKTPLELFTPEKLLDIESEISDWFIAVQNMWSSSCAMQLSRISLSDYSHIITKYKEYETVKGVLVHHTEQKKKDAEEEARAKQYAQIQRAGDEGEKRVKYVLDCLGSDTIQVGGNTVNKYGKPCIMLISEKWTKFPQEFDHIIIRENGVFLIETKNLSGTIEIDQSGNWTQTKGKQASTKIAIDSPAFQTYRHEKLVRSFLAPEIQVSSIICLANQHTFVKGQENCNIPVLKWDLLAQFIEERPAEKKLSREEMEAVHEQIKEHYYECATNENGEINND